MTLCPKPTRIPWFSRTISPPGNVELLRRAVGQCPHGLILESVGSAATTGRYSLYVTDPVSVVSVEENDGLGPFDRLEQICKPWSRYDPVPDLPFVGGWIGYLAYETGRFTEPSADWPPTTQSPMPIAYWALYDTVLIHDAKQNHWTVAGVELPQNTIPASRPDLANRLNQLEQFVTRTNALIPSDSVKATATITAGTTSGTSGTNPENDLETGRTRSATWSLSRDAYLDGVKRSLEYIRAGDIFQVNLTRRLTTVLNVHPLDVYLMLCKANPAAFAAYLQIPYPDTQSENGTPPHITGPCDTPNTIRGAILSSSPELFLAVQDGIVTTKPIKGTRPRGKTPDEDAAEREALERSEKDRAELNMIVDLERNDLGRVCKYGSVRVIHDGELEQHPTVFHRTATIRGQLRDDCDAIDLLRATFPGGSITGAPKVRAMQIIQELEPTPRGPYCGAIGYIGLNGDMQLNLPIRTLWMTPAPSPDDRSKSIALPEAIVPPGSKNLGHPAKPTWFKTMLHVGSGIVADSDPEDEYAELEAKAAGMMTALRQCTAHRSNEEA